MMAKKISDMTRDELLELIEETKLSDNSKQNTADLLKRAEEKTRGARKAQIKAGYTIAVILLLCGVFVTPPLLLFGTIALFLSALNEYGESKVRQIFDIEEEELNPNDRNQM